MIVRPPQHWFIRLFTWHGSVLSSIIFRLSLNVGGNDSNLLIVFYVQIMPDDFVMQLHRF
ncbi:Uncharacterised protein [Raoultella ornithinolytica]|uniref:Uncharacterized protein n=1 Tax=Raoultella terrigena TaxID=577 RepID=A0A7Z8ZCU8_RAOTE|nr:hypothetical protein [Klebsiella michiganensis]STT62462.1 Uncharacterised protein [Raoultella ornithinolytica]VED51626.1 Uncharacterised protein [Raoultella terrigena]